MYFSRNFYKLLGRPRYLLLLTVLPLDSYLTPTGLFSCPLLTALTGFLFRLTLYGFLCQLAPVFSLTFLSSSTSGLVRDLEFKPFEFRAKTEKEIVCQAYQPHSVTIPASHPCHLFTINYHTYKKIYNSDVQEVRGIKWADYNGCFEGDLCYTETESNTYLANMRSSGVSIDRSLTQGWRTMIWKWRVYCSKWNPITVTCHPGKEIHYPVGQLLLHFGLDLLVQFF